MAKFDDPLQKLQQNQESLEFALQSGRMGTWDINLETNMVTCSPEMLKIWNIHPGEFTGQRSHLQDRVHPDDLRNMNEALNAAIQNQNIYEHEFRIRPSEGIEKWVLSRGRLTYSADSMTPTRFAGVVFDITEKKEKEKALAQALKAREQFFMIASHELRTPLTCMQLQIQVMEWDLKNKLNTSSTSPEIEIGLKKQKEYVQRIKRIIDNILDESKIAAGSFQMQFEKFDLSDMLNEIIQQFKVHAQNSGVELIYKNPHSIPGIWDRFRLEQVLINLLSNALRFGNKRPINVTIDQKDRTVLIMVKDLGIGIRPENQSRVFQRIGIGSVENDTSGMGMGLYISKTIIEAHGGDISLKSSPNGGSQFTVTLPVRDVL